MKQGTIVLVNFSYSNLTQEKFRPAFVLSSSAYNQNSQDVILVRISTKSTRKWSIPITKLDLSSGSLDYDSFVIVDSIFTVEKHLITAEVGALNRATIQTILAEFSQLIEIDPEFE